MTIMNLKFSRMSRFMWVLLGFLMSMTYSCKSRTTSMDLQSNEGERVSPADIQKVFNQFSSSKDFTSETANSILNSNNLWSCKTMDIRYYDPIWEPAVKYRFFDRPGSIWERMVEQTYKLDSKRDKYKMYGVGLLAFFSDKTEIDVAKVSLDYALANAMSVIHLRYQNSGVIIGEESGWEGNPDTAYQESALEKRLWRKPLKNNSLPFRYFICDKIVP